MEERVWFGVEEKEETTKRHGSSRDVNSTHEQYPQTVPMNATTTKNHSNRMDHESSSHCQLQIVRKFTHFFLKASVKFLQQYLTFPTKEFIAEFKFLDHIFLLIHKIAWPYCYLNRWQKYGTISRISSNHLYNFLITLHSHCLHDRHYRHL